MAKHRLTLRQLKKILKSYGVEVDASRGKGSHVLFSKQLPGGTFSYPVPGDKEVLSCYVRGCRKRFLLTADDGITDDDFFGRA